MQLSSDTVGALRRMVGKLTNTSDVVLGFDNNTAFANGSPWTLGVAILNSSISSIVSSNFSPGLSKTLVASNVPPVVWVPESAVLQTNQQSVSAIVPIGSGTRFFRLIWP